MSDAVVRGFGILKQRTLGLGHRLVSAWYPQGIGPWIRGVVLILLVPMTCARTASAQATPTASGPGSYVAVGGGASIFQQDYGRRFVGGGWVFADVNPTWRFGLEGEARWLRLNGSEEVSESNYLAGIRVALSSGRIRPYAKFLAGDGHIVLPFHYATGDFFTLVPGAGIDFDLSDRWTLRAADFEYQLWQSFPYGSLHPYGVSFGLSFRLNGVGRLPKSARRSRQ